MSELVYCDCNCANCSGCTGMEVIKIAKVRAKGTRSLRHPLGLPLLCSFGTCTRWARVGYSLRSGGTWWPHCSREHMTAHPCWCNWCNGRIGEHGPEAVALYARTIAAILAAEQAGE